MRPRAFFGESESPSAELGSHPETQPYLEALPGASEAKGIPFQVARNCSQALCARSQVASIFGAPRQVHGSIKDRALEFMAQFHPRNRQQSHRSQNSVDFFRARLHVSPLASSLEARKAIQMTSFRY